jgi:hypothetical protein
MNTPEDVILEMNWTFDSDPGRFQLWEQLIKPAMIRYASLQTPSNVNMAKQEAIGLAKWIRNNRYEKYFVNLNESYFDINGQPITDEQLYNLYKQSTPIPIQTPCVELEKEVERLKGKVNSLTLSSSINLKRRNELIEYLYKKAENFSNVYDDEGIEKNWQQFKTENNL